MKKLIDKFILIGFIFSTISLSLFSQNYVYYSKYSVKYKINKNYSLKLNGTLKFKEYSNYYRKFHLGFYKKLNKNFKIGFFYANKSKEKDGWKIHNFLFPELTYKVKTGILFFEDRNRVEYFLSEKEFKYRNRLLFILPLAEKIEFWFGDEIKYFFKNKNIGKYEVLIGIKFKILKKLNLDLFYDYQSEREFNLWANTNIFGTKVTVLI